MAKHNELSKELQAALASPLRCELASDIWLHENGYAPNSSQDADGFAKSNARRELRAGGSRGPAVATRIIDDLIYDYVDNNIYNNDPLSLLIEIEDRVENDDFWGNEPIKSGAEQIAAISIAANRTRRRGQQIAAHRRAAAAAGQTGFAGFGWGNN